MTEQLDIAYYIRSNIQHLPPVLRLQEELPGPILTADPNVVELIKRKYPEHAARLVFLKRTWQAKSYVRRNKIRILIYPAFKNLNRGLSVEIFHGGLSDKRYLETSLITLYDLVLFPGQKSADKVEKADLLHRVKAWEIIGYPKFDPLVDRSLQYEPVFSNGMPTVLYAPTWISETRPCAEQEKFRFSQHGESSIPRWGKKIVQCLPEGVNLIIKFHSRVHGEAGRKLHDEIEQSIVENGLKDRARVVFDDNILPYMDQSAIMISDISSACYEWFHFDRPILFANPSPEHYRPVDDITKNTYAWQAGDVINEEPDIARLIEKNLAQDDHRAKRNEIFHYSVFSPDGNATKRQADAIRKLSRRYEAMPFWRFHVMTRARHFWRKLVVRFVLGRGIIKE
ncbi:MAG: hypothetical protein ACI841_004297 [Planctomycetota bacterium]|jgi:hypothetical protein